MNSNKMPKVLFTLKKILTKNFDLVLLTIILLISRFYRLEEFITFLGDQGRDALIIKRLLLLEKLTLIGPPTSIGGVFLGPFYYYLMTLPLAIFRLDPLGLAFFVALLSVIFCLIIYFIVKKSFGRSISLFLTSMIFSSFALTHSARYSWNPNLLPYISFFFIYYLWRFRFQKTNIFSNIFLGVLVGIGIQLHYLAILMIPLYFVYKTYFLKSLNLIIRQSIWFFSGFLTLISPLFLFDIKHNFVNIHSFISAFNSNNSQETSRFIDRIRSTLSGYLEHVFGIQTNYSMALIVVCIFLLIASYLIFKSKVKNNLVSFSKLNLLFILIYLLGFSMINSSRHYHYYNPLYISTYLLMITLATLIADLISIKKHFVKSIFILILISPFIITQLPKSHIHFYLKLGNNQLTEAKKLAEIVFHNIKKSPYQITAIPSTASTGHIRYFLEIAGKPALDEEDPRAGEEMFVYCYEQECNIDGHPQWQIANFQRGKTRVSKIGELYTIKIYKIEKEN